MARALSMDMREKIVQAYEKSLWKVSEIARMFGVDPHSVRRFVARYNERGDLTPDPTPGRTPILNDENLEIIKKIVLQKPDGTLSEHRDEFEKQTGISVTYVTIHNACKKLDLRFKKKASMRLNKKEKTCK